MTILVSYHTVRDSIACTYLYVILYSSLYIADLSICNTPELYTIGAKKDSAELSYIGVTNCGAEMLDVGALRNGTEEGSDMDIVFMRGQM
jgi:hypothetical protein